MSGLKYQVGFCGIIITILISVSNLSAQNDPQKLTEEKLLNGLPLIFKLEPEKKDGSGYKLVCLVNAPLDVYWRFKIDFDKDFLLSNKFRYLLYASFIKNNYIIYNLKIQCLPH